MATTLLLLVLHLLTTTGASASSLPPAAVTFTYPAHGGKTRDMFDVQIHINTADAQAFKSGYDGDDLCLSLDGSSFSCWPIFEISRLPRFVGVHDGAHTLVGMLKSGGVLIEGSKGTTSFTSSRPGEQPALPEEPQQEAPEHPEKPKDPPPQQETVKIPQVQILSPRKLSTVANTLYVISFKGVNGMGRGCVCVCVCVCVCRVWRDEVPRLVTQRAACSLQC